MLTQGEILRFFSCLPDNLSELRKRSPTSTKNLFVPVFSFIFFVKCCSKFRYTAIAQLVSVPNIPAISLSSLFHAVHVLCGAWYSKDTKYNTIRKHPCKGPVRGIYCHVLTLVISVRFLPIALLWPRAGDGFLSSGRDWLCRFRFSAGVFRYVVRTAVVYTGITRRKYSYLYLMV